MSVPSSPSPPSPVGPADLLLPPLSVCVQSFVNSCKSSPLRPHLLPLLQCSFSQGKANAVQLHAQAVVPSPSLHLAPIHAPRIISSALSQEEVWEGSESRTSGYLTMDASRRVVLLSDTNPKSLELPLLGL